MGEKRNAYRISVGKPEGKRPLGKSRRRREDNIKMDLKQDGLVRTGLIWLRIGPVEGSCEHSNEPSATVKFSEFFECLSDWQLLKMGSAPWS
jgi:hypothetical protein